MTNVGGLGVLQAAVRSGRGGASSATPSPAYVRHYSWRSAAVGSIRAACPDAERQRADDDEACRRGAAQHAQREFQILQQAVHAYLVRSGERTVCHLVPSPVNAWLDAGLTEGEESRSTHRMFAGGTQRPGAEHASPPEAHRYISLRACASRGADRVEAD
jgi:hypothetical protein